MSDNGPEFVSDEFKAFVVFWALEHFTSSLSSYIQKEIAKPRLERSVKQSKRMLIKCENLEMIPCLLYWRFRFSD